MSKLVQQDLTGAKSVRGSNVKVYRGKKSSSEKLEKIEVLVNFRKAKSLKMEVADALPVMNEVKSVQGSVIWIASRLSKWFSYIKNYKDHVEDLKDVRLDLDNKVCEIQEKVKIGERRMERIVPAVDKWLKEAEEFTKEDIWEEFTEENIRIKDRCFFGLFVCNPIHRYNISKKVIEKAEEARRKLDRIKEHGSNLVTLPVGPVDLASTPIEFSKTLGSREMFVRKVLAALADSNVQVIGIHGMGGAGKTTLVEEVARRAENEQAFDSVVIAEVSQTPNIRKIQAQVAERIGLPLDGINDADERARKLYSRLKQVKDKKKKIEEIDSTMNQNEDEEYDQEYDKVSGKVITTLLVILDNVWKRIDLNKVGIPCQWTEELRCKIVLTSRSKEVCRMMGAADDNIFEVEGLDNEEAKLLFRERVGDIIVREEYQSMEDRLLEQCAHLPLAVAALADALKNQSLSVWKRVAVQLEKPVPSNVSGVHGDMYSILQLSYNFIDSEEKKLFFLMCCLFPMGSSISTEDLVRYGIGLGLFQHVNSITEAIEQANLWADELKSSSLLLKDEDEFHIKIHDVVRAAAMSIAANDLDDIPLDCVTAEECMFHVGAFPRWLMDETYKNYSAISMMSDDNHVPLGTIEFPKLQTLILQHSRPSTFPNSFFLGMRNLKILAMSGMTLLTLPSSISLLSNLRTLHLTDSELKDISVIGDLNKLLVLSLRNSKIEVLPGEVGQLSKLRLLDLTGCSNLKTISANVVARLTLLEGLYMDDSFESWVIDEHDKERSQASCGELKPLSHLKILEIRIPTIEHLPEDVLFSELAKFDISIGPRHTKFRDLYPASRILVLSKVNARVPFKKGPAALLRKAESLAIIRAEGLKNVAYDLDKDGLSELRNLYVLNCNEVQYITNSTSLSSHDAFPKLEKLALYFLDKLEEICHGELSLDFFCHLQKLKLFSLPGLTSVWSWKGPVKRSCNLRYVIVDGCGNLIYIFSESVARMLGKLEEFHVSGCSKLHEVISSEVEGSYAVVLHCLKELVLYDLPNLGTFWSGALYSTGSGSFHGAKTLFNEKIQFPSLENLTLKGIGKIERLWILPPISEDIEGITFSQLRSLHLVDLPILRHIWGEKIHERSQSFRNLKVLKIVGCESLECVFLPSVAAILAQLEQLQIEKSKNMKEIITRTEADHDSSTSSVVIKFPKLTNFGLYDLTNLKCFCQGSFTFNFPALKTLNLRELPLMKAFIMPASEYIAASVEKLQNDHEAIEMQEYSIRGCTFFSRKVFCPSLEELRISYCHKMEYLLSASASFPELKELEVRNSNEFRAIIVTKELEQKDDREAVAPFPELKKLKLDKLPKLVNCISGGYAAKWLALEIMEITTCDRLTSFTGSRDLESGNSTGVTVQPFFKQKDNFPALKILHFEDLKQLGQIWDFQLHNESFCQLKVIEVILCPKLRTVIPFNILQKIQNLKELIVKDSDEVEELFMLHGPTSHDGQIHNAFSLPQVRMLVLVALPKLIYIPWTMFENLSSVRIRALGALTRLFSAPAGQEPVALLPHLQKIEELTVGDCDLLEDMCAPGEFRDVLLLPRLRRLKFASLYKLKQIKWSRYLCSFRAYRISGWKYLFSLSIARYLVYLEELSVEYCYDMEVMIPVKEGDLSSGNKVVTFPRLRNLKLYDLPRLRCFFSENYALEFPSLKSITVTSCHNMETFSAGPLTTPQLNNILVDQKSQGIDDLNVILQQVHKEKVRFILQSVGIYEDERTNEEEESDEWFEIEQEQVKVVDRESDCEEWYDVEQEEN